MHYVVALVALLAVGTASADNLPGRVFAYECKQVSATADGFTCTLVPDGAGAYMKVHFTQDILKLPDHEQERKRYRYDSTLMRYFDLGGTYFELTYAYAPDVRKTCAKVKDSDYTYRCN